MVIFPGHKNAATTKSILFDASSGGKMKVVGGQLVDDFR